MLVDPSACVTIDLAAAAINVTVAGQGEERRSLPPQSADAFHRKP
jgi:hypothetical protein